MKEFLANVYLYIYCSYKKQFLQSKANTGEMFVLSWVHIFRKFHPIQSLVTDWYWDKEKKFNEDEEDLRIR